MKTIAITVLFILYVSGIGLCQDKKNEISLSYGIYSTNGALIDETMDDVITVISLGTEVTQAQNIRETGPILISYKSAVKPWLGLGATAGYVHTKYDWTENSSNNNGTTTSKIERACYTIASELDFRYIRKEKFTMYSLIGLGYTFVDDRSEPTDSGERLVNHIDMHISLLGFRFGKDFGAFVELGAGYKGLVNFGMNYRF